MNKNELIAAIAASADLSKAAAARALDATLENITNTVAKGDQVILVGFGSFKASPRAARAGKNPKTGEAINIPATVSPKFTPGAAFKAAVAKK